MNARKDLNAVTTDRAKAEESRSRWANIAPVVVAAVAVVSPGYLLWMILSGSRMQFGDYFYMIRHLYDADGSFNVPGLFTRANEHLVVLPKLIYSVNYLIFEGSNISLGVFVWALSALTAFVVGASLWSRVISGPWRRVMMIWVLALFAFPLPALHNYLFAMSGAAWMMASMFAVVAIVSMVKSRPLLAAFFGVLGTLSYGTGIAIWAALFILFLLLRRFSWQNFVMVGLGIISVALERFSSVSPQHHPPIEFDLLKIGRSMTVSIGSLLTNNTEISVLLGSALIPVFVFLAWRVYHTQHEVPERLVPVGIGVFALSAAFLFAMSRTGFGDGMFTSSRYMGVMSLFMLSILLMVIGSEWSIKRGALVSVVAILALATSAAPVIEQVKALSRFHQELGEIATKLGLGQSLIFGMTQPSLRLLETLEHYPFSRSGDSIACGVLGETVTAPVVFDDRSVVGWIDSSEELPEAETLRIDGWVYSEQRGECLLVLDSTNQVVGGGVIGWDREDARQAVNAPQRDLGWIAVAPFDEYEALRVGVFVPGRDEFFIFGELTGNDLD